MVKVEVVGKERYIENFLLALSHLKRALQESCTRKLLEILQRKLSEILQRNYTKLYRVLYVLYRIVYITN